MATTARSARLRTPPHPRRPAFSPMMEPRQRLTRLLRVECGEWAREPGLHLATEFVSVVGVLEDGRRIERVATVTYKTGERERVMEAMINPALATNDVVKTAVSVLRRRIDAVEIERRKLWREFAVAPAA